MFNGGQTPASIFSPICTQMCTGNLDSIDIVKNLQLIHSNCLNHELYSEPSFPAPQGQLYLLSHTLNVEMIELDAG